MCSNSTGNTKKGRKMIYEEVQTIINLGDCCHHIQNMIKDINKLPEFKEVSPIYLGGVLYHGYMVLRQQLPCMCDGIEPMFCMVDAVALILTYAVPMQNAESRGHLRLTVIL